MAVQAERSSVSLFRVPQMRASSRRTVGSPEVRLQSHCTLQVSLDASEEGDSGAGGAGVSRLVDFLPQASSDVAASRRPRVRALIIMKGVP
jgi:hypothetical protein